MQLEAKMELVKWMVGPDGALELLRGNVEVDDNGLAVLLRALEVLDEIVPNCSINSPNLSFEVRVCDEIAAVRDYISGLKQLNEDGASPETEFPLHLASKEDSWTPRESLEKWGFVVAGFYTPSHAEIAQNLRKSCQNVGLPFTFHETAAIHISTSPKASTDLQFTKPNFIHAMIERHGVPVLYVDCDCVIMAEPIHVRNAVRDGIDFAITNHLAFEASPVFLPLEKLDPGLASSIEPLRYFKSTGQMPWLQVDQLIGNAACMLFSNTDASRALLRYWHQEIAFLSSVVCRPCTGEGKGVWSHVDDQILDWVFNNRAALDESKLAHIKTFWLPASYARQPTHIYIAPIINHPGYPTDGPRLRIASRHALPRFRIPSTPIRKTLLALEDLNLHEVWVKDLVIDIKGRKAGHWQQGTGLSASIDLDVKCWPPHLYEWGDWPKACG